MPVKGADAVPKKVSLEASNCREEKFQTNDELLKAVTVQSVVPGTIVPMVNDPMKLVMGQHLVPDVWVTVESTANISPGNTVGLLA